MSNLSKSQIENDQKGFNLLYELLEKHLEKTQENEFCLNRG
jgi:hypothetical protein